MQLHLVFIGKDTTKKFFLEGKKLFAQDGDNVHDGDFSKSDMLGEKWRLSLLQALSQAFIKT